MKDLDNAAPTESPVRPLVERLRDTPNWMRESYGSWKDGTLKYDCAPFEAADEIERLRGEVGILQERRCEICGYAEHHREHTGCLRTQLAAAQAVIEQMREVIAWYADEARACSKNALKESLAPEALLASVTVLALDGGRRADSVLATDNTALRDRLRQERERVCEFLKHEGWFKDHGYVLDAIRNMGEL